MSRKERHEFIAMMYEHSPHHWRENDPPMFIQRQAELLMRYSVTLHRLAEELCNGYQTFDGKWDEKRTQLAEKKQERIDKRAAEVAAAIGGNGTLADAFDRMQDAIVSYAKDQGYTVA